MPKDSPLGLTNLQGVEKTETRNASNNQQANANQSLVNQDPEVTSQVKTANNNRNPTSTSVEQNPAPTSQNATSVFNPTLYTHFNYRGTTDANKYEPNKLVPDQHEIGVESLVDYLRGTAMELRFVDFVYLKKLGVYANNRMIVARRFAAPVLDDLFQTTIHPISTVVSWVDPESEFFKIGFNEEWTHHTESIQKIFGEIASDDFGLKVPEGVPGWAIGIQFEMLKALGVTNAGADNIPEGNPNLIMETSRRHVPGTEGGSGIKSDLSINMKIEYEIKYIPGIDPSFAFNDIIANLAAMGTSNSEFYLTGSAGAGIAAIVDKLKKGQYVEVVKTIIEALIKAVTSVIDKVVKIIAPSKNEGGSTDDSSIGGTLITAALNSALTLADEVLNGIISKYRVKIFAAINAMTGAPNAPWHITIGNPRKPFFVSGDMICDKVELEFGKELGYNDLPTEITAHLTFKPARNWGAQEITSKFNSGKGRIYDTPTTSQTSGSNAASNTTNVQNSQGAQNKSAAASNNTIANGPEDF